MTRDTRRDPPSLGFPRLYFAFGGQMSTHEAQREFALVDGITTIGSADDADLRLEGLEQHHAEIRLGDDDHYTYVPLCEPTGGSVHGREGIRSTLRTGTLIELGPYTVSFYREEFADGTAPDDSGPGRKFARMRADAHRAEDHREARRGD